METVSSSKLIKRRNFITQSCAVGTSLCLGCSYYLADANAQEVQTVKSNQDKYALNSEMSYEQVFNFAYRDLFIPQLIAASKQIGRENFIEIFKTATDEVYSQPEFMKRFNSSLPKQFWSNVLNQEVIENTPDLRVVKITKCLWAKTFREANAADIGYAMLCYGDYANARSNNQKLERDTTLMQGHECCLLKWTKIG
jgi:hypothetical protein